MSLPDMKTVGAGTGNVRKIGYDNADSALYVEFAGGATYRYAGVPLDVWQALNDAHSKGSFVHSNIRSKYSTERLDTQSKSQ